MGYLSETIALGTVKTLAMPPQKFAAPLKMFQIINHGPDAISHGVFEWSADEITWGTLASVGAVAADADAWYALPDGRPFIKFSAASGSGEVASITYKAWFE